MMLIYLGWPLTAVLSYFAWRSLFRHTGSWTRGDRRLFLVASLVTGPAGLILACVLYWLDLLGKARGGDRPARW